MRYPGELIPFFCDLSNRTAVTTAPIITILDAQTDTAQVLIQPSTVSVTMPAVAGANSLYKYLWNTTSVPDGDYVVLVSYVADGVTVNNVLLREFRLGDSRVTGVVALDATVAKAATVAKDATVMHLSDFVAPTDDLKVQLILSKVTGLPAQITTTQSAIAAVASDVTDIHDTGLGNLVIDKAAGTLTLYRTNGTVLKVFNLSRDSNSSRRIAV